MSDRKVADNGEALTRFNKDMGDNTWAMRVIAMLLDAAGNVLGTAANPLSTSNAPLGTSDLTPFVINSSTAGTTTLVAAVAGQTTKVYRLRINVAGANVLTIKDGANVLETINFPGAGILTYDYATRPWYKTSLNSALTLTTSTTAQVNGVVDFITGV